MTKQNDIAPLVTTRKPTPEEWLANHERLHNEHLKRLQKNVCAMQEDAKNKFYDDVE